MSVEVLDALLLTGDPDAYGLALMSSARSTQRKARRVLLVAVVCRGSATDILHRVLLVTSVGSFFCK